MAAAIVIVSFLIVLIGAELQPHRTVVDLQRLNSSLSKQLLQDTSKSNITIGFLSSFKELGKLIAGAIPLAVDMVNTDPVLLPNHNLRFIAYDSGEPNTAITIKKMTQMKEEGVMAFIGPDHSCVSEALVAAAWNMPMITYNVPNKCCVPLCKGNYLSGSKVSVNSFLTDDELPQTWLHLIERKELYLDDRAIDREKTPGYRYFINFLALSTL